MRSFLFTALAALILGIGVAFLLFGDGVNTTATVVQDHEHFNHSQNTSRPPLIQIEKERLHVEEILQLSASKERMKWRIREMSEVERLHAAEQIAAITGDEIDTPIEILIDRIWERWSKTSISDDSAP